MATIKFLCLCALIPLISCRQINFLPFEEVTAYLNDEPSSDYEVVSLVHTLHKRSLPSTMRIRAFQRDIELYLEPNENYLFGRNTPVYLSHRGADDKNTFTRFFHDPLNVYHDLKNNAALVVEQKQDKHLMYGMIGDYMIRPLTGEKQLSMRNKRSTDSKNILTARDNEIFADDHVLIKINQPKEDHIDGPKISNRIGRSLTSLKTSNGTNQDRLFPEILVSADYNYFKKSGGDVNEFIKYQAVFWNGVDLVYRYFEDPEIRLNIAGIVISQESSADIYHKTYVRGNQLNIIDFMKSFKSTSTIHDEDYPKISYDIVVALTSYELVLDFSTKNVYGTAFGIATFEGACTNAGIAVIRDLLKFFGVRTTAHEMGHLFGAPHDISPECETDFIMGRGSFTENQSRWSNCSVKYMRDFFKSKQAKCLRNEPVVITSPYKKFLPGEVADIDAQCENLLPGSKPALNTGVSVCHRLICEKVTQKRILDKYVVCKETNLYEKGASEGSSCENGGICIQGDCIKLKL